VPLGHQCAAKNRIEYTHPLVFSWRSMPRIGLIGGDAIEACFIISVSQGVFLDLLDLFQKYWPILALALWFAYKWWNSKRIVALLPELRKNGAIFVDVRSAAEFAQANAPGTMNIPLQELGSRLGELPKSSPVVLCCASGTRSGMAKLLLKKNGYRDVYNIGAWSKFLG